MKNKAPDWFISSLRWSFAAIAFILLSLGIYRFIYYSEMDYTGKVSSGFSFLSLLGIFATICVYFWQKKDAFNKEQKIIHSMKSGLLYDIKISRKFLLFLKRAASNGIRRSEINHHNIIEIQEMASSTVIFINRYVINVMIPEKSRVSFICSQSMSINSSLYQSTIDTLNLIDKILILYTHIKYRLSNDLLSDEKKRIYIKIINLIDIKNSCDELLIELKKIEHEAKYTLH